MTVRMSVLVTVSTDVLEVISPDWDDVLLGLSTVDVVSTGLVVATGVVALGNL